MNGKEEEAVLLTSEEEQRVKQQWEQEQVSLRQQLILHDDFSWTIPSNNDNVNSSSSSSPCTLKYLGGVDISFNPDNREGNKDDAVASLVICSYPDLKVVYESYHRVNMDLPYIPGFLGFREVPHLVNLVNELRQKRPDLEPDVILVDGNGILHPRGFGLASHLGVLINIPTIGIAKNLLYMDGFTREKIKQWSIDHLKKTGDVFELTGDSGMVHGAIFKGADKVTKPIFISIGHRVSLETSIQIAKLCCKFRIPEPVRQADLRSRDAIREINKEYDKNHSKST